MRGEDRNRDTACVCVCDVYRFCVHTCSRLTCLSGVGPVVCPGLRLVFRCVCTLLCFIQPSVLLLLLLTWPPLFSCPPDRQYARAPPQSFIGSYCHRTQIQYASIDCVEMQSGSPQQRSKQSKFNRTPPPAFSPALIAPPREEQMYLCVRREIFHVVTTIVRRSSKKLVRPRRQSVQEVTSALTSLPAKWAVTVCF